MLMAGKSMSARAVTKRSTAKMAESPKTAASPKKAASPNATAKKVGAPKKSAGTVTIAAFKAPPIASMPGTFTTRSGRLLMKPAPGGKLDIRKLDAAIAALRNRKA